MIDQEDKIKLGKIVFDDNNQERKSWACLGQTCSSFLIVFFSQLSLFVLIMFGCFWRIHLFFLKLVTSPMFEWEFCVVQQDTFYRHQDYEQGTFYKKLRLYTIGRSLRDGKVTIYFQLAPKWNLSTRI